MKNFFTYRGSISRIGFILILIGVFLLIISFAKGIQILIFIPALVIALFIFSFLEVRNLKKVLTYRLMKEGDDYLIDIKSPANLNFFFRIGQQTEKGISLLSPEKNGHHFPLVCDEDTNIILFIKGTFDILRLVVPLGSIERLGSSFHHKSSSDEYRDSTFFFVREYELGDNISRLDSIKSSLKNIPFIKSVINFDASKNRQNPPGDIPKLSITSNRIIREKDDTTKGNILKWILILINCVIIYTAWEDLFLTSLIVLPSIGVLYVAYYKKYTFKNLRALNLIILALFAGMIIMTIVMSDMSGPGSVFLTGILISKQLFSDDREDGFLYIFLSLFVFVAVSLFSVALWFILFFLIYLIVSVFLLTSVSGYMVSDPVKGAVGTGISYSHLAKTAAIIFFLMTILFFVLPHGDKAESTGSLIAPKNPETVSGFSSELDFKNAGAIKMDTSKVIAVDNLGIGNEALLKNAYWRGVRFSRFRGVSWVKSEIKKAYSFKKQEKSAESESLTIHYLSKGTTNLFFPNIPEFIELGENSEPLFIRVNSTDNSIFSLANRSMNPVQLNIAIAKNNNGAFMDIEAKYSEAYSGSNIDTKTEKLFAEFWSKIDRKKLDTPAKLTAYIKNNAGFSYSIESPAVSVKDFLYGSKRGHCEYFATVLTITLQHFGYNATLVNGYYSGEWNDLAGSWIIRGKDAHSWTEVYEGSKWRVYDATPSNPDIGATPFYKQIWTRLGSVYDYLDLKWYNYIVNYSGDIQRNLFRQTLTFKYHALMLVFLFVVYRIAVLYRKRNNASYEQKLLRYLRKATGRHFPLDHLASETPSLVEDTRNLIYGEKKLIREDYLPLYGKWKEYFKGRS